MLYKTLVALIAKGRTEGLSKKIDVFYATDKITEEQYTELTEMLLAA